MSKFNIKVLHHIHWVDTQTGDNWLFSLDAPLCMVLMLLKVVCSSQATYECAYGKGPNSVQYPGIRCY